ncbi:DMT family transporter [Limnohabitans radicicola]|uniref:DMT family transporter n=1 Tax=Limnohabitans radicicola TaxID=2771427 RepID=A0A927FDS3_9BURK|nr:DMT family transporter [Limnohabitans radicicola]MBD8049524.1 DMT family transporter [Limnohabitans radicicola]
MNSRKPFFHGPWRRAALAHRRTRRELLTWPAPVRGMLWMVLGGILFTCLNTLARGLSMQLDVYETQFLRYLFGLVVMLPLVWRHGWQAYRPVNIVGQFWRGGVHTLGLILWFTALPNIPLADMTAIGFTGPIFIMLGAAWFLGEPMHRDRWVAALIGFAGVLVVVLPKLSGSGGWYNLIMLASSPVFAASFLITKALTRYEKAGVIVLWQALTVTVFSLPMALPNWQTPTLVQWGAFAMTGVLGTLGHYCLTRAFHTADISATQSLRFLDLVWASVAGWLVFGDVPSQWTWAGALVILGATVWIARREGRRPAEVVPD